MDADFEPHQGYAGGGGYIGNVFSVGYLNNIIEQDHRFVKKRIVASRWFRSVPGAVNTIQGDEAMHMIRKGQIRWLPKGDIAGQVRFVNRAFGLAA